MSEVSALKSWLIYKWENINFCFKSIVLFWVKNRVELNFQIWMYFRSLLMQSWVFRLGLLCNITTITDLDIANAGLYYIFLIHVMKTIVSSYCINNLTWYVSNPYRCPSVHTVVSIITLWSWCSNTAVWGCIEFGSRNGLKIIEFIPPHVIFSDYRRG